MREPTPETTSCIVLLRPSRVKANGTLNTPGKSSQVSSGAERFGREKIRQLQTKLTRTAAIEIKLLRVFDWRKNNVIVAAETSGANNAYHGSMLFMSA